MNIGNIIKFDTGNARGISVVVFVSGCEHFCSECHNKETWSFDYGKPLDDNVLTEIKKSLANFHIKNLVISGGDPLHPRNLEGTLEILTATKEIREKYNQNAIVYTGYVFNKLREREDTEPLLSTILEEIDYLIDGKYDPNKKTKGLDYRGSTNQQCLRRTKYGYENWTKYYFKECTEE